MFSKFSKLHVPAIQKMLILSETASNGYLAAGAMRHLFFLWAGCAKSPKMDPRAVYPPGWGNRYCLTGQAWFRKELKVMRKRYTGRANPKLGLWLLQRSCTVASGRWSRTQRVVKDTTGG